MLNKHTVRLGFILCFSICLVTPRQGRADVSWLETVNGCDEFQQELVAFYKRLETASAPGPESRAEIQQILKTACGERFAACKFSICANRKSDAGETGVVQREEQQAEPEWLAGSQTCDEFVNALRTRFAQTGSFADLEEEKKRDLRVALRTACNDERYKSCRFAVCYRDAQLDTR